MYSIVKIFDIFVEIRSVISLPLELISTPSEFELQKTGCGYFYTRDIEWKIFIKLNSETLRPF